jgi:hypothetical protein
MSFFRGMLGLFNSTTDVLQYIFVQIVLWILIVVGLVFGVSVIFSGRFEWAHTVVTFVLFHPWWTIYPALIAMLYLVIYWILDNRDYPKTQSKEK